MPSRLGFRMLGAIGVAIVVGSCCCEKPAREIAVARFSCPGDPVVVDIVDARTGTIIRTVNGIGVSEPITDIPEFHDCQRFIVKDHYDSLYAIFAAFRLEDLDTAWQLDSGAAASQGKPGVVPAATIYSHGGTYDSLGIKPGFNCLFFFRQSSTSPWQAKMVPWGGSADPNCADRSYDPLTTGTPLTVHKSTGNSSTGAAFGAKDYPPVARWDWDERNGKYYISIACGAGWCEVGKDVFESSPAYNLPLPVWKRLAGKLPDPQSPATSRVHKVRGWYDVQRLAVLLSSSNSALPTPGPARGFLIPHPLLDSINNAGGGVSAYRTWGHVAAAMIEGDYDKWNFKNGENDIFLCFGTTQSCLITDQLQRIPWATTPLTSCPEDLINQGRWWAKVVSATGVVQYACIGRMDHADALVRYNQKHPGQAAIPGAARWHWIPTDETQWVSCLQGCCTVSP